MIPIAPPPIPGIGTTGGFEFWIQDTGAGDPAQLDAVTQDFLRKARTRPELTTLYSTFRANTQQLRANVDRDKATLLGVPDRGRLQRDPGAVRLADGEPVQPVQPRVVGDRPVRREVPAGSRRPHAPLHAIRATATWCRCPRWSRPQWVAGPDLLPHFNGFPAAKVNGNPAPGYSSGDALAAMEATAREVLPPGYTFAWSGLAFEEKKSGGTSMIAFVFGLIIVFLVLAAQYESWTLPGAVMSAVPFGILGALVTNWLRGLENDVYFQIGLLVLIGLGAKNAVLRVSAAVEFRHQGKTIMEATVLAGEQRLRPIIMTSLAFAFGCLPLALALGAGANARHSIGTGIIGGMIGETTLAMLYVPLLFYLFDRMAEGGDEKADAHPPTPAAPRRRCRAGAAVAKPHAPGGGLR